MKEREFVLPEGSLYYEIVGSLGQESVRITGGSGRMSVLVIPGRLEGYPVTEIGKKAFLSRKHLREVILPSSLRELGDWAFAYCSGLERVSFPERELRTGRSVFQECAALKYLDVRPGKWPETGRRIGRDGRAADDAAEICADAAESRADAAGFRTDAAEPRADAAGFRTDTAEPRADAAGFRMDIAALQAAAIRFFEAYYLLDPVHAGDAEWLAKWDSRLLSYLHTDDHDGYARQVLCGEEDYGSTDLDAYLNGRRKEKVRLAYLRLLNPVGLRAKVREELQAYLLSHTKGCAGEEAWEILLGEHGEDRSYYELFARIGCLTQDNFDRALEEIGEEFPEMKAYFLKYKEEKIGYADFFAELSLDL